MLWGLLIWEIERFSKSLKPGLRANKKKNPVIFQVQQVMPSLQMSGINIDK